MNTFEQVWSSYYGNRKAFSGTTGFEYLVAKKFWNAALEAIKQEIETLPLGSDQPYRYVSEPNIEKLKAK